MEILNLVRDGTTNQARGTIGQFLVSNRFHRKIYTLELPWLDNKKNVSCIPEGEFPMWWGKSKRFGDNRWHVEVPGRRGILIHVGNYLINTEGCILTGLGSGVRRIKDSPLPPEHTVFESVLAYGLLLDLLDTKKKWLLRVVSRAS